MINYENGDRYKGGVKGEAPNHIPHGHGKMTFKKKPEDGDIPNYYEGEYENGVKKGKGKRQNLDGSKYDGDYKDDKPHGLGIYTWADGDIYDGGWKFG